MKNIFSKISSLLFIGVMVAVFSFSSVAFAGPTVPGEQYATGWKTNYDCPTLSVANANTNEGTDVDSNNCWYANSISATYGQTFQYTIFFHNSTGSTQNVSVKMNDPRGKTGTITTGGTVFANGVSVATAQNYVNVPSDATIRLVKTTIAFPKSSNPSARTIDGNSVFSGYNVGNLESTHTQSGYVKVSFAIDQKAAPIDNTAAPTATTYNPTNVSGNTAVLQGAYTTGGLDTVTGFKYYYGATCSGGLIANTLDTNPINHGSISGNSSHTLKDIPNGTYSYRILARNSKGTVESSVCKEFTIGSGIVNPPVNQITLTTNQVSSVSNNNGSATLNGYYSVNTSGRIGFQIWNNNNSSSYNNTFMVRNVSTGSGNYQYDVSGLADGTYVYRAYFVADNGTETRADITSFTISRNNSTNCSAGYVYQNGSCVWVNNNNNYTNPTAQTLNPTTVNTSQATFDGYYTTGSCSGATWFEYGTTQSLGSRTSAISRAANSAGNMPETVYGLSPNTTYYYRVVSQNCQNTAYASEIRSFTTTRPSIVDNITRIITPRQTNTTTQVVSTSNTNTAARTNVTGGTGVKYLRLNIDNDRKEISRGDSITYEVQWENISSTVTLNDLVLEVTMPKELQITSSSRGDIDRTANAVYLNIDRLDPREEGRMTVTTRMNGALRSGDPVVGRVIGAFENPTLEGAQENAIAYDSDRYENNGSSVLGASAFGIGFLPGTLAGWLIILLIIVLIILAARHYMRSGYNGYNDRDHGGPYTPYRPQS